MSIDPIIHQSPQLTAQYYETQGNTATLPNGLTCYCTTLVTNTYGPIKFTWKFNWETLKKQGIDGLSGQITVNSPSGYFQSKIVDVDLTETTQSIDSIVATNHNYQNYNFTYHLSLLPYHIPIEIVSYDEMFLPSDKNDTILVVEGKKLHVNKAFLSYHSDFFGALFSSNFKEGQMEEIPINDVSYEDLCLLLGSFHPYPVFPNDKTVEKLLEMADRFVIPSVIGIVEYHLIHNSKIKNEKMMWMADAYGMPKLLQKTITAMNTTEKAKKLKASPEYKKLSDGTKSKVLDRLMVLI